VRDHARGKPTTEILHLSMESRLGFAHLKVGKTLSRLYGIPIIKCNFQVIMSLFEHVYLILFGF
jgi:hypothetical protein